MYAKDLNEPKYQFLINVFKKREDVGIKHLNNPKVFIQYSQCMDDVYNNIDDYKPTRKRNVLIVFDDMITDIMTNKKFQAIIKELFMRCRKLNISFAFITQSHFCLKRSHIKFYTLPIHNKKDLQNIANNHSADIDYKDFMNIYRKCTSERYSFLTTDTTLPTSNCLKLTKNLLGPL